MLGFCILGTAAVDEQLTPGTGTAPDDTTRGRARAITPGLSYSPQTFRIQGTASLNGSVKRGTS